MFAKDFLQHAARPKRDRGNSRDGSATASNQEGFAFLLDGIEQVCKSPRGFRSSQGLHEIRLSDSSDAIRHEAYEAEGIVQRRVVVNGRVAPLQHPYASAKLARSATLRPVHVEADKLPAEDFPHAGQQGLQEQVYFRV